MDVLTPDLEDTPPPSRRALRERRTAALRRTARTRKAKFTIAMVVASTLVVAGWTVGRFSGGDEVDVTLSGSGARAGQGIHVGTRFTASAAGSVEEVTFYDTGHRSGAAVATLWSESGALIEQVEQPTGSRTGWRQATFDTPVRITADTTYIVSLWSPDRLTRAERAVMGDPPAVAAQVRLGGAVLGSGRGFPDRRTERQRRYVVPAFAPKSPAATPTPRPTTSATSRPTPTPTPSRTAEPAPDQKGFPNAGTTGVPAGTTLTPSGECTISKAGTVIENKTLNCDVTVRAAGVVIRKSRINGTVNSDSTAGNASVTIEDSEIDGGKAALATVRSHHVTVLRSEVRGGQHSVQCNKACTVKDSWLHGQYQPPNGQLHQEAFISNGGSDMHLVHNTLSCDAKISGNGGACTADVSIFGDFEPNSRFTFDRNLFVASTQQSYCVYGGYDPAKPFGRQATNIVFTNNVFERGKNGKCGLYGPVVSFNGALTGNVWKNNTWDDGKTLNP